MRRVVDVIEESGSNGDGEPATIEARIRNIISNVSKRRLKDIAHWEGEVSEAEYEKYLGICSLRVYVSTASPLCDRASRRIPS